MKHREEKQSPKAEQQAKHRLHSKQSGVLPCRIRWLGWRRVGPAATPTTQQRCRRTSREATSLFETAASFRTRYVVLNRLLRRLHPSASFRCPASSLKARTVVVRWCPVCLSLGFRVQSAR